VVDDGAPKVIRGVGLIEREALLTRLRENADVPVVVVHAGAGFGKTTLASQWAQRDPRPHQLVRSARFLDDPAALALALIDAFESVGPAAAEPGLRSPERSRDRRSRQSSFQPSVEYPDILRDG
jgi:ATP/maltotriose-dependent transcriptional regulator MalT